MFYKKLYLVLQTAELNSPQKKVFNLQHAHNIASPIDDAQAVKHAFLDAVCVSRPQNSRYFFKTGKSLPLHSLFVPIGWR